jgi:MFS family permease
MIAALLPVRSLLLAIFVLMAGAGFIGTLVSVRLEAAGASPVLLGVVASAYFGGLAVGSLRASRVIGRVGHIRAFAAFVSLLSASTLAYSLHQGAALWAGLRFLDGLCVAGVYVCLESWLNERASRSARGSVLAAYMVALYTGQALGQFLLTVGDQAPSRSFVVASMLVSVAVIPIALTRTAGPALGVQPRFPMRQLYAISPLGLAGAAVTGVVMGAFYGLGAVYARRLGMSLSDTAGFMSAVIAGGVVLQWPLGWLSDRFDRRIVIVAVLFGVTAVALALALAVALPVLLLALGAGFGGLTFALYPLCVAHTNDHLAAEHRVGATGGLVLAYSAGAACGPLAGAAAMSLLGGAGLFAFIAAAAAAVTAFGLWRLTVRPSVPPEQQQTFQGLPRTTPVSAALDPLAHEGG